jgi:MarR family transcriptional regulator, transcriptional regulator for hemolysin
MLAAMSEDVRTTTAVDLSMLLNQASYAVTSRLSAALAEIDVSVKVYCVLKKGVEGDFTQAQLAERAWMDKTTMVNVLDEMERNGLAVRTMSPTDRRVRVVAVTAKGRSLLAQADKLVQATYDTVLDTLSASHKAEFIAALSHLVEGPLAAPFHMEEQLPRTRRAKNR